MYKILTIHARLIIGVLIGACLASFASFLFANTASGTGGMGEGSVRIHSTQTDSLIAPLLLCGSTEPKDFGEYKSLESELKKTIAAATSNGTATQVSVYARDMKGTWVGVNEDRTFTPASLMKVPLMIAYLKQAEGNPALLHQKLTYDGTDDLNKAEVFKSTSDLEPGSYTIDTLLHAMISDSDNNAMALLLNNIDTNYLSEIYTDLGLSVPGSGEANVDFITPKQYSYFFRILYNATYLNSLYSEKALKLLAEADFTQGIRSIIPPNTIVAQKFGERTEITSRGEIVGHELHDCGIVYDSQKPYFLCIMTKGANFQDLIKVIQSIATVVQSRMHLSSSL